MWISFFFIQRLISEIVAGLHSYSGCICTSISYMYSGVAREQHLHLRAAVDQDHRDL